MDALYGIKFIAFLGIFFHHLAFPTSTGSIFTTFFFVFAGFITAYNFERKKFKVSKGTVKSFYLDKFIKNYPIYIVTLLATLPFVKQVEGFSWNIKDVLIHGLMLQTIIPRGTKTYMFNGLSWFLVDLMIFYLLIPFIYKGIQRLKIDKSNKKMIFCFISIIIIEILFSLFYKGSLESYSFGWWLLYISPISRLLNLMFGFFLGLWFYKNMKVLKEKINKVPKIIITVLEIASLINIYLCIRIPSFLSGAFVMNGTHHLFLSFSLILIFGLNRGYISDFFKTKVLVYLGKLSLPCYMTHQLVINYLAFCCFCSPWYNYSISLKRNIFDGIFILVLTLCISDVLQRHILIPFTKFLQKKFIKGE